MHAKRALAVRVCACERVEKDACLRACSDGCGRVGWVGQSMRACVRTTCATARKFVWEWRLWSRAGSCPHLPEVAPLGEGHAVQQICVGLERERPRRNINRSFRQAQSHTRSSVLSRFTCVVQPTTTAAATAGWQRNNVAVEAEPLGRTVDTRRRVGIQPRVLSPCHRPAEQPTIVATLALRQRCARRSQHRCDGDVVGHVLGDDFGAQSVPLEVRCEGCRVRRVAVDVVQIGFASTLRKRVSCGMTRFSTRTNKMTRLVFTSAIDRQNVCTRARSLSVIVPRCWSTKWPNVATSVKSTINSWTQ
jgi:hypothetical protein